MKYNFKHKLKHPSLRSPIKIHPVEYFKRIRALFRDRFKYTPIKVIAPLKFAKSVDEREGWVRISEDVRGNIPNASYIKVSNGNRIVYCQVRGTPRETGVIRINEYYRELLGFSSPQASITITVQRVRFWRRIDAISSHPNSIVRMSFGFGLVGMGFGLLGISLPGLTSGASLVLSQVGLFRPVGIGGLITSSILLIAGLYFFISGLKALVK